MKLQQCYTPQTLSHNFVIVPTKISVALAGHENRVAALDDGHEAAHEDGMDLLCAGYKRGGFRFHGNRLAFEISSQTPQPYVNSITNSCATTTLANIDNG